MQKESETLVGLSVGTTEISVIVAEKDPRYQPDAIHVIGMGSAPSRGLSKGVIVNLNEAAQSVRKAIREAENITARKIDSAIVAFNALDVESIITPGMVALIQDGNPKRVEPADLGRLIESAQSHLELPSSMCPIHTIPVSYTLDDRPVDEPLNMTGARLNISLLTTLVPQTYVRNVETCVGAAEVRVKGLVLKPLAASLGAIAEEEMRAGCISVSVGGGATGIVLYQGGRPSRIISIPIGGYHITSDLSYVLQIPLRDAENVKKRIFTEDEEVLKRDGINIDLAIQTIGARVEELFMDHVKTALAECTPQDFPGGVILSGGVANTPGIVEMLSDILQMQVRRAQPLYAMPPGRENASCVCAAGLLRYMAQRERDDYLFIAPELPEERPAAAVRTIAFEEEEEEDEGGMLASTGENLRNFLSTLTRNFKDLF